MLACFYKLQQFDHGIDFSGKDKIIYHIILKLI